MTLVRPLPADAKLLAALGKLQPKVELIYYDAPLFFTTEDAQGNMLLALLFDSFEEERFDTYLLVPCTQETVAQLQAGAVSMYRALDQPVLWAVDVDYDYNLVRALELHGVGSLPPDMLPAKNETLYG